MCWGPGSEQHRWPVARGRGLLVREEGQRQELSLVIAAKGREMRNKRWGRGQEGFIQRTGGCRRILEEEEPVQSLGLADS